MLCHSRVDNFTIITHNASPASPFLPMPEVEPSPKKDPEVDQLAQKLAETLDLANARAIPTVLRIDNVPWVSRDWSVRGQMEHADSFVCRTSRLLPCAIGSNYQHLPFTFLSIVEAERPSAMHTSKLPLRMRKELSNSAETRFLEVERDKDR